MINLQNLLASLTRLSPGEREQVINQIVYLNLIDEFRIAEPATADGASQEHVTFEEFLKRVENSPRRYEYVDGAMYAMAGASEAHNIITVNLLSAIQNHLRDTGCRAFAGNFLVYLRNQNKDYAYLPDIMVKCGRTGIEKLHLREPKLVIEVLSPSTQQVDRREKRINYASIESLQEYVLVSQDTVQVVVFRRANRFFGERFLGREATVELKSIELSLSLNAIYEDTSDVR